MIVWTTIAWVVRSVLSFFLGYRSAHLVRVFTHVGVVCGVIGLSCILSIHAAMRLREESNQVLCGWNLYGSRLEHEVIPASLRSASAARDETRSMGDYYYPRKDGVGAEKFVVWYYHHRDYVKPPPGEDR
jgi:hypothetical protein